MARKNEQTQTSPTIANAVFKLDRETKGAVVYKELGEDGQPFEDLHGGAKIGTLYLRKTALGPAPFPETLSVVVTVTR